jgi:hypothetical protein
MKSRLAFLCVAIIVGAAIPAFAEYGFKLSFEYTGSYDSSRTDMQMLYCSEGQADGGMTSWGLLPDGIHTIHEFKVYVRATGLAATEDITAFGAVATVGGCFTQDLLIEAKKNEYLVDPPPMGGSDAPEATWDSSLVFNSVPYIGASVRTGSASGIGGNKYGDYAAYMQLGEAAPFLLGTVYFHTPENNEGVTSPDVDRITWTSDQAGSYFKTITGNTGGLGTAATDGYRHVYAFYADSIYLWVPEPSTSALMGCGLFGLLLYTWRRRAKGPRTKS